MCFFLLMPELHCRRPLLNENCCRPSCGKGVDQVPAPLGLSPTSPSHSVAWSVCGESRQHFLFCIKPNQSPPRHGVPIVTVHRLVSKVFLFMMATCLSKALASAGRRRDALDTTGRTRGHFYEEIHFECDGAHVWQRGQTEGTEVPVVDRNSCSSMCW